MSFEARLTFRCASDVGVQRQENQDSFGYFSPQESGAGWLFVVADGMGGAAGGATASQLAVETIARVYRERTRAASDDLFGAVRHGIEAANSAIHQRAQDDPDVRGMGTTANVLVIKDEVVFTAHVGDSRTYRFRDGRLECLTRDHTQVQELVDQGIINPGKAKSHPQGHIISRNLGGRPQVTVDIPPDGPFRVRDGDVFLVCSDGLYGMVPDEAIAEILAAVPPEHATPALIDLANRRGGADNITVCVVCAGTTLPAWASFDPSQLPPLLDLLQNHRSTDTATFNVQVRDALEPSDFDTARLQALARPAAPPAAAPAPTSQAPPAAAAAPRSAPAAATAAPASKGKPLLVLFIVLFVLGLLAAAGLFLFFLMMKSNANANASDAPTSPSTVAASDDPTEDEADDADSHPEGRASRSRRRRRAQHSSPGTAPPPAPREIPGCTALTQQLPPALEFQPYEIILDKPQAGAALLVTVQSGEEDALSTRCSIASGDTVRLPRQQDMLSFHVILPALGEVACKPTFEGDQPTHVRLRCTAPSDDLQRQLDP